MSSSTSASAPSSSTSTSATSRITSASAPSRKTKKAPPTTTAQTSVPPESAKAPSKEPVAQSELASMEGITPSRKFSEFSEIKNFYYISIIDSESPAGEKKVLLNKEKISFVWSNINLHIANTYRRILISEIPTFVLGNFRSHNFPIPGTSSSHLFEMSRLQPVMHNEQLSLVLELIPINQATCKSEQEDGRNLMVTFGYTNAGDHLEPKSVDIKVPIQSIYTSDLVVYSVKDNHIKELDNSEFFMKKKVLVTKLKMNQKLAFIAEPIFGFGKESAKFSPVCSASYEYDANEFQSLSEERTTYQKVYETETILAPVTKVKFSIHSLPYYTPEHVAMLGFIYFKKVFERLQQKIHEIFSGENTKTLKMQFTEKEYASITVDVDDENYTVGNILQHYLLQQPGVVFAACIIEHPKIKKLKCKATIRTNAPNIEIEMFGHKFREAISAIMLDCDAWTENFTKKFKSALPQ